MSSFVVLLTDVNVDIASDTKAREINCDDKVHILETSGELRSKLNCMKLKPNNYYFISSNNYLAYDLDLEYPQFNKTFSMEYLYKQSKDFFGYIAKYIRNGIVKLVLLDASRDEAVSERRTLDITQMSAEKFELKKNVLYTLKTL